MSDFLKKFGMFILKLLGQKTAQNVVLDVLQEMAKKTDNELDDRIIRIVRLAMENEKDLEDVKSLMDSWEKLTGRGDQSES